MKGCTASAFAFAVFLVAVPARSAGPTKKQCVQANDDAQDLRQAGKLRQAREKLVVCAASSCPAIVRADCAERISEVDAAMPSIVFEAKDAAGNDISAVRVTIDGQPFEEELDATPRPLDPGEHRFVFKAWGLPAVELVVVVREGDKAWHERVVMGTAVQAPARERPAAPATPVSDGSTQRMVGLAVGGAGVVGVVLGSILGIVAKSTYDHALGQECGNRPTACSPEGALDGQAARSQATVSTVAFVAGLALLGSGAVLYFTAPQDGFAVGPAVGTGAMGLQARGAW